MTENVKNVSHTLLCHRVYNLNQHVVGLKDRLRLAESTLRVQTQQIEDLERRVRILRACVPAVEPSGIWPPLTRRQYEVAVLVAKGKTYREIGTILGIAASTVSSNMFDIYRRLDVPHYPACVVSELYRRGWLPPDATTT